MTTTKTYRLRTHAGRWADLQERLESYGIPYCWADLGLSARLAADINSDLLIKALDRLQEMHLPLEAVSLLAEAIVASYKLGRD